VAKEKYLSLHSFDIAIDINVNYSNYWLWDLQKLKGKTILHLMDPPTIISSVKDRLSSF